ncbi:glycosyltransferase family 4 protein [Pseudomonas sp. GCM10022186]|uniref:glycosyltransferase family 4 protein n=1 Tax=Pseudomonas sp. GCM10022186 TaxID=3252650 RepID=UPI00360F7098
MKKKFLFLGQLPPPTHGASVMNVRAHDAILEAYPSTLSINLSNASDLNDVGSVSLLKLVKVFFLLCKILYVLTVHRPSACYFALCPSGVAFYRDAMIVAFLKVFRVKRILHLHGRGIESSKSRLKRAIYRFAFAEADVIHLSSLFWREVDGLVEKQRFWVVPNCAEDLVGCRKRKTEQQPVHFFYFSNFVRGKGALYLLQAARILHEQQTNCRISLAGDWFDLELKDEIERWKIENEELITSGFVSFSGALYDQEKIDFIAQGDVLVFPSYIDTFPLVVVEALSAGKAVIASSTGAVPEILSGGECGLLFPEHDVAELVRCISTLAADKSLVGRFGDVGRRRYEAMYRESAFKKSLLNTIGKISAELY